MHAYLYYYTELFITGVPGEVSIISFTNTTNGNNVDFLLIWDEPVNNYYDPIIMYHVSCSGDAPCPLSYNISDNHTISYTFTGFNPNGYYTFSVVATNSVGSREAGVVMVGENITTTTIAPPSVECTASDALLCCITSKGLSVQMAVRLVVT